MLGQERFSPVFGALFGYSRRKYAGWSSLSQLFHVWSTQIQKTICWRHGSLSKGPLNQLQNELG